MNNYVTLDKGQGDMFCQPPLRSPQTSSAGRYGASFTEENSARMT